MPMPHMVEISSLMDYSYTYTKINMMQLHTHMHYTLKHLVFENFIHCNLIMLFSSPSAHSIPISLCAILF